jgi:hypothetical protein
MYLSGHLLAFIFTAEKVARVDYLPTVSTNPGYFLGLNANLGRKVKNKEGLIMSARPHP